MSNARREKTKDDITWVVFDAKDQILGRLSAKIAYVLRGKHCAGFSPDKDLGFGVIVINSKDIKVTGGKEKKKVYYRHSGYPGGISSKTYEESAKKDPTMPLYLAVKGMLPKNRLGRTLLTRVRIYADSKHPHTAQNPVSLEVNL